MIHLDGFEERAHASVIFDAWRLFDARRHVDSERPHAADCGGDVLGRQAARQKNRTPSRNGRRSIPIDYLAGSSVMDRIPDVEQERDMVRPLRNGFLFFFFSWRPSPWALGK